MNAEPSATTPDFLARFIRALLRPTAALTLGVELRELSHNTFLHFMLQTPLGPRLVQEVARVCAPEAPEASRALLEALASEIPIITKLVANRAGEAGRPDERIFGVVGGEPFMLVVELKVMAPLDAGQLDGYLAHEAGRKADLWLHLPGRHQHSMSHPVLDGIVFAGCVDRALSAVDVGPDAGRHVRDYLATLELLDAMDCAIVDQCDAVWHCPDLAVKRWLEDSWRWVEQRLLRAVAADLSGTAKDRIGPWRTKPDEVGSDPNGAYLVLLAQFS